MMELRPVGVGGVLAVLGNAIRSETGAQVAALREAVEHAHICGLEETVPAYASLLVKYDPFLTNYDALCGTLRALERQISASTVTEGKIVEIPVCYGGAYGEDLPFVAVSPAVADGAYGEDLPFVARHAGMTEREVVALHSGQPYRIYMLGFLPGFPYLGGLDERLHTPRLSTPRTRIPAGSVGIGGKQTGVYPMESPGGWQLIGRTPLTLFAPGEPLPYAAGDRIRFVPIDEGEFERIQKREEAKRHGA